MRVIFIFLFLVKLEPGISQSNRIPFSLEASYGVAGSFFVRSYEESNDPVLGGSYYNKNFIGSHMHMSLAYDLSKNSAIGIGYTRQQFAKRIIFSNGSNIFVNAKIRHINNIWELKYGKSLFPFKGNSVLIGGIGVYYLRPQQEEVDVTSSGILWEERDYKYFRLEEAGVFVELKFEHSFQDKVEIGLKSNFYFTITSTNAESISISPYIKISF